MSGEPRTTRGGGERRLYVAGAVLALVLVVVGFARTYYLKGWFGTPALPSLLHVHGAIMTAWFVLFAVQTWLVASRRVAVHRRLGIAGAVVAALVLVVGAATAIHGARRGATPGPPPLVFLAVPLGDLVVFGALVGTGLALRGRREVHRRLMLLGTLGILPAATARLPFLPPSIPVFFGIPALVVLACVAYDTWRNRRLHPAAGWGAALVVLSYPARLLIAGTETWLRFAAWVTA